MIQEFFEWMISNEFINVSKTYNDQIKVEGAKVITDGIWDIKKFISTELSKYTEWTYDLKLANAFFSEWIDIKKIFLFNYENELWNVSIDSMLKFFGFSFEGRQHSGIDDARNIAKIVIRMLEDAVHLKITDRIKFQCGDFNSKERYIRYSDDIFRRVTYDLKCLNKILNLDAKHNPYSSHNLFSSYHFVGKVHELKYIVKGFQNNYLMSISNVFFSIRSQKKGKIEMRCDRIYRTKYSFYEETSPQSDEFEYTRKNQCMFRRSTFSSSMPDFIRAFLSCRIDNDENVHLTLCLNSNIKLYLNKDLIQKGIAQPKQRQNEFSIEEFLERIRARSLIFSKSENLMPPKDLYSMEEWIDWRLKLLTIRKHLNSIKLSRREELLSNHYLMMNKNSSIQKQPSKKSLKIDDFIQNNDCHYEFHMVGDSVQAITTHNHNLCW